MKPDHPPLQLITCQRYPLPDALMGDPMIAALELSYTGPTIEEGPLPALFYFALSAEESLTLDPFNQPAAFLRDARLRIFSMTLPGHGPGQDKLQAMEFWADQLRQGVDMMGQFMDPCIRVINYLIASNIVDDTRVASAGL